MYHLIVSSLRVSFFEPFLRWLLSRKDFSTEPFHLPNSDLTASPTAVKYHIVLWTWLLNSFAENTATGPSVQYITGARPWVCYPLVKWGLNKIQRAWAFFHEPQEQCMVILKVFTKSKVAFPRVLLTLGCIPAWKVLTRNTLKCWAINYSSPAAVVQAVWCLWWGWEP